MLRFISILALITCTTVPLAAQTVLKVGSPAPLFSAVSYDGKTYDLNDLRGSVVVLTFWSTRCIICQSEMPKLDQMADRYRGKKVVFLSATPEDESRVRYYLSLNQVRASTILPSSFGLMLQYADRERDGSVNIAYPAFFVIDGEGDLQYRGSGYSKTAKIASTVDRLLK